MDDEQLPESFARRDRDVWAILYDRHVSAVYGFIYHLSGRNREIAEDVNQEVWLLAIDQAEKFDPARGDFRTWLLGIARHRILRRRRSTLQQQEMLLDGPVDLINPPELFEELERADVVRAALLCLRDDPRRILLDKYSIGLSVAEIARRNGMTAKAVESALTRAREQLRALLSPYFSFTSKGQSHVRSDTSQPH